MKAKPCPKCGHPADKDPGLTDESGKHIGPFSVACPAWHFVGPYTFTCENGVSAPTMREAVAKWNAQPAGDIP